MTTSPDVEENDRIIGFFRLIARKGINAWEIEDCIDDCEPGEIDMETLGKLYQNKDSQFLIKRILKLQHMIQYQHMEHGLLRTVIKSYEDEEYKQALEEKGNLQSIRNKSRYAAPFDGETQTSSVNFNEVEELRKEIERLKGENSALERDYLYLDKKSSGQTWWIIMLSSFAIMVIFLARS